MHPSEKTSVFVMCPGPSAVVLPAVSGLAFRPPCVSVRPLNRNARVMLEEVRYRRTTAGDEKLVSALSQLGCQRRERSAGDFRTQCATAFLLLVT